MIQMCVCARTVEVAVPSSLWLTDPPLVVGPGYCKILDGWISNATRSVLNVTVPSTVSIFTVPYLHKGCPAQELGYFDFCFQKAQYQPLFNN